MKTKTILVVAAALMAASCSDLNVKNYVAEDENTSSDVRFAVWTDATKAIATTDENKVSSLQMFVFGSDGSLEIKSGLKSGVSSVNLQCTKGEKKVVAVVNAPELTTVKTYTDFQSLYSRLADNKKNKLVMVGDTTITVSMSQSESVEIQVKRLGVRVALRSIANRLTSKSDMTIKKVYLINAAGNRTYLGGGAPTLWYNQSMCKDEVSELLTYNISGVVTLTNNGSREFVQNYAYCYPNPVETDTSEKGEVWTERFTRAVVEAQIGDITCYYPINLPGLKANTAYNLSLIITRIGSDDPDIPVTTNEITYSLDIVDWTDGGYFSETI